jgi:hypothetical protein
MTSFPERQALRHKARVFIQEARRRKGSEFAKTLKQWACNTRRQSHAKRPAPAQGELF